MFYHGSDQRLSEILPGSYVTKSWKDAMKFGYRKAVSNNSENIHLYTVELDGAELKPDPNRDRAFQVSKACHVTLLSTTPTFAAVRKLKNFRKGPRKNA